MELDRTVLEHARALLLALAVLVERAAGLPTVKRLWFLEVMGRGEAEARRLIVAMASDAGASGEAGVTTVHAAGDAAQLAARFRMLALAVDAMLAFAGPCPPRRLTSPAASHAIRNPLLVTSQFTLSPALRATSPPQAGERSRGVGDDALLRTGHLRTGRYWCCCVGAPSAGPSLFSQGLPLGPVALARPCR